MNLDALNKWLTLGANLGVLIGLIVVIVEINQNTVAQNAASVQAVLGTSADINMASSANPAFVEVALAMRNGDELSQEQLFVLDAQLMAVFAAHWQIFQLREQELVVDDLWYAYERRNIENMGNPGIRSWWDENKHKFGDGFQTYLDGLRGQ